MYLRKQELFFKDRVVKSTLSLKWEDGFSLCKYNALMIFPFVIFDIFRPTGQGRLDGAICEITEDEKMNFLKSAVEAGVRNIEMESSGIASLCNACGIKGNVRLRFCLKAGPYFIT